MRCFRSFFVFLLGIVVGVVGVVGTAFGAVYFIGQAPMREVNKWLSSGGSFQFTENVLDMSVFDYGKNVYSQFSNLNTATIGELEIALGTDIITSTMEKYLGIPKDKVSPYTIAKVADAVTENLTLGIITTKFGISLPDLPAFKNEEFLNQPIKTAFSSLDSFKLKDFVVIVTDEDVIKDPTLVPSPKILQKFADLSLSEMSSGMGDVLNTLKISDIVDVVTDEEATPEKPASPKILQTLAKLSLGEMSSDMGAVLETIKLGDIVEVVTDEEATPEKPASPKILQQLADMSLTEMSTGMGEKINTLKLKDIIDLSTAESPILQVLGESTIASLPSDIDGLAVKNVFTIDDNSSPILKKLTTRPEGSTAPDGVYGDKDVLIKDLGSSLDEVTKTLKIGDIVTIDATSPLVLQSLKDATLGTLDTYVAALTLDKLIPIVTDEEAAADPTLTASSKLLQYIATATTATLDSYLAKATLGDFVEITADSPSILKALAGTAINDFGTKVNSLKISELITIDANSSPILVAISDLTLTDMSGDGMTNAISGLKISELISFSGDTSPILDVIKDLTLTQMGDGTLTANLNSLKLADLLGASAGSSPILNLIKDFTLEQMSDGTLATAMDNFTISQMIPSGATASPILTAIGGLTLADMASPKLTETINTLKLSELIPVTDTSSPMLKALADTKIAEIDAKIATFTIGDVFGATPSGALGLVPTTTALTSLPTALAAAFSTKTLGELSAAGVLTLPDTAPETVKAMTLPQFVDSYMEMLAIIAALPTPPII